MIIVIIIAAILMIGCFVGMTAVGKNWVTSSFEDDVKTAKRILVFRWIVCGGIALILAAILVIGGIRIIDSTEIGVVRTWGQIDHEIGAGLNLINPISDSVEKYDLRVHVRTVEFASYTKDAQAVEATVEYQYKLRPSEIMDIAKEYGSYEVLETKLTGIVEERVKTVFSTYSAMPLLENRANLSPEVLEKLRGLQDLYHIEFTTAVVNNIDFSDAFEASVEAKMRAEQDALKAEQEKKTAIVKAEQDKEVAVINAEAAIAQAEGEAKAIQIVRDVLINMPEAYIQQMWIEKWDGKLPTVQSGDGSMPVVVNPGLSESKPAQTIVSATD